MLKKLSGMFVVQAVKHVLDFIGFWPIAIAFAIATGATVWTWLSSAPLPVLVITTFSSIVASIYVALLPRLLRTLFATKTFERPDLSPWSRATTLRLYQAACLLAEIHPNVPVPAPARGHLQMLISAAREGKFKTAESDPQYVTLQTEARAEHLKKYVESTGMPWFA
ncbi:hypothetical protein XI03_26075 [Bradyrhizobium sp. CCBAU 65884]|uniref:hypothetical protein n=1 Tax=Bradyrhizobium sp. CCBAU 65884 TaxID=722477 RepID=UPI0023054AD6|nr:hypothetical protein [Bradyrhizobium sp. CCBAU 65884]MDA9477886.1 hypothetical protein [Bradyrhizobium sp. CCBAU 65884]